MHHGNDLNFVLWDLEVSPSSPGSLIGEGHKGSVNANLLPSPCPQICTHGPSRELGFDLFSALLNKILSKKGFPNKNKFGNNHPGSCHCECKWWLRCSGTWRDLRKLSHTEVLEKLKTRSQDGQGEGNVKD